MPSTATAKGRLQLAQAERGMVLLFGQVARRRQVDSFLLIDGALPLGFGAALGMRFADVDQAEVHPLVVFGGDALQVGGRTPQLRAGVTSEHQHDGRCEVPRSGAVPIGGAAVPTGTPGSAVAACSKWKPLASAARASADPGRTCDGAFQQRARFLGLARDCARMEASWKLASKSLGLAASSLRKASAAPSASPVKRSACPRYDCSEGTLGIQAAACLQVPSTAPG